MSATAAIDLKFERDLLDSLGRLWLSANDKQRGRLAVRHFKSRVDEAPPVAFKHKVTTIMAANVRELCTDSDPSVAATARDLAAALQPEDDAAHAHRRLLLLEVAKISALLGNRGCIIKGFCNSRFYPEKYDRWMRDIDIFCPAWSDALGLLEALLEDGYHFDLDECSWVKADEARGRAMYGQIFLIRPEGSDFCRVDIHYGTYSIGYAGYLSLPDEALMTPMQVGETFVNVLDARLCPLIAQSHALSDGYVAIKDVNDFVALAMSVDLEWAGIGKAMRAHQLHPQAALLARHVARLYDHPRVVAAARAMEAGAGRPRFSIWQTHNRSWRLRAAVNTSFAARWKLRQGGGPFAAAVDAVRCYLFYSRRLQLAVRDRRPLERALRSLMAEPDLDGWGLRPDACTLLIDAGVVAELGEIVRRPESPIRQWKETPESAISVTSEGATTLVRMQERIFVPTLDLLIPPSDAIVAARV